jgi:dolichol-phosphate mannosyltransferase
MTTPDDRIPALSLIVPTYNERDRLAELVADAFTAFRNRGLDAEIIVVDDNSPDGTGIIADALAAEHPVRVVHRSGKLGLGTAVLAGFNIARAPIVGVIDADFSHPPGMIPDLIAIMTESGADFVVGSRYIAGGGTRNWPIRRLLMSRLACLLARPLTPVTDATSGFFFIRRSLARGVTTSLSGFKICLELLVRGRPSLVVEVPYLFEGRMAGQSKMNGKEAFGYLVQLVELWQFRRAHPAVGQVYSRCLSRS